MFILRKFALVQEVINRSKESSISIDLQFMQRLDNDFQLRLEDEAQNRGQNPDEDSIVEILESTLSHDLFRGVSLEDIRSADTFLKDGLSEGTLQAIELLAQAREIFSKVDPEDLPRHMDA